MIVFVRVCHTNRITDDQIPQAQRNHSFIASKVYYFVAEHIIPICLMELNFLYCELTQMSIIE